MISATTSAGPALAIRDIAASSRPSRAPRAFDAVWIGVLTAIVSIAGGGRPSLWFDEAATISASTRTVPELWRMLGNIDAVHGLYYLIMHGWFTIFPATEFWSRLSSAMAVGVAAAGVVVLAKMLASRSVAITAGIVFAILPRVTWAGIETRSYALSMVLAVWITIFVLEAARRNKPRWWLAYSTLVVAGGLLNVFLVLIVPVHAVVVATASGSKPVRRAWVVSAGAGLAAITPFLLFTQTQLFQVRWITTLTDNPLLSITRDQYFDHAMVFAILAGIAIVAGLIAVPRHGQLVSDHPWRVVVVAAAWATLPTIVMFAYSALRQPIYYPRYLSFTTPAMALLIGFCVVVAIRSRVGIAAAVLAFVCAAVPNYLAQRGPYAKEDMDYSSVADVITRYAAPGDCLVMDNSAAWKPGPIRPMLAARPAAFQKLHDYGRGQSSLDRNMLWDGHTAIWMWADKLPSCPTLWTVSERDATLPDRQQGPDLPPGPRLARAMAFQVPSRFGFHVVERWQFSFAQVAKSTR